jgi:hypothetical protein
MKCPYCGNDAELSTGYKVYPHRADLADLKIWACFPCDAWVGTHKNSPTHAPLGRLANAELRKAKMAAHAAFDPLWKSGQVSRKKAYALLSEKMGLTPEETHIGMFDVEQCKTVILLCTPQMVIERRGLVVYS